ncbi:hypothetical protein GCM10009838_67000 [Catenulispora subtropica]|uniref:Uncharacterized protein n=1 Tax=Catenulispora subtropica TaxID=450798 RepID=A0ABN2SWP9_9ACTN
MARAALSQDISADRPRGGARSCPGATALAGRVSPPAWGAPRHGIAARCGATVFTKL